MEMEIGPLAVLQRLAFSIQEKKASLALVYSNLHSPLTTPQKRELFDNLTVCRSKSMGENGARKKKKAAKMSAKTPRRNRKDPAL